MESDLDEKIYVQENILLQMTKAIFTISLDFEKFWGVVAPKQLKITEKTFKYRRNS